MHDAILVQDACNLSGVVHSLAIHCQKLREEGNDTDEINKHPATVMYVAKLAHLCGIDVDWSTDPIKNAYKELSNE